MLTSGVNVKNYQFPILIEKDEDGYYVAACPVLQGCYTQGKSYKEALERIKEVIELHIEARGLQIDFIPAQDVLTKV